MLLIVSGKPVMECPGNDETRLKLNFRYRKIVAPGEKERRKGDITESALNDFGFGFLSKVEVRT